MIVRPAREEDYDALARVWLEGWRASSPKDFEEPASLAEELRSRIPREVQSGNWDVFAADEDGRIVGFLAITRKDAVLNEIFVGDGTRSRGVGKAMLEVVKRSMPGGFWLRTHITNTHAQRFYEREGLKHTHDAAHPNHPEAMFRHYRWAR